MLSAVPLVEQLELKMLSLLLALERSMHFLCIRPVYSFPRGNTKVSEQPKPDFIPKFVGYPSPFTSQEHQTLLYSSSSTVDLFGQDQVSKNSMWTWKTCFSLERNVWQKSNQRFSFSRSNQLFYCLYIEKQFTICDWVDSRDKDEMWQIFLMTLALWAVK